MKKEPVTISRREFLIRTTKASVGVGAGFSLGLYLTACNDGPANLVDTNDGAAKVSPPEQKVLSEAKSETPEVGAWVVIEPDDTVIIRIARSEMGQGTLTGLAQMVAEELECDWSRVTTVYPTPGQNLARDRVWRSFSTGGSQGIRSSHLYVRKGGAVARHMLIEAAAEQ
ncbi:MAG: molybdopterin-dependent oxidoreductase, partial [Gammaproteobacteria bacterium]